MKLSTIVDRCDSLSYSGRYDPEITNISSDSRNMKEGGLFIAIEGYRDNGLLYIEDAISRGARAIILEDRFKNQVKSYDEVPFCFTSHARKCALNVSRVFYGNPSRGFTLIGITGTNGKTTITYLIEAILRETGKNPGIMGTISHRFNNITRKAKNTTPDPIDIQSLFYEMKEGGVSHVIMEVSSHALAMDRIEPRDFDFAVFTNLSQDHLDFHGTMEEYFKAKARLFLGLNENASAVINRDDSYGQKLLALIKGNVLTYGIIKKSDYMGRIDSLSIQGTKYTINGTEYSTRLVGEHNVYNILAAHSLAKALEIDDETIGRAISGIKSIPGRFERVTFGKGYHVFVDYAHTPDALDHLLDAANVLKKGRIITVFGCGGDRDRGKRPKMGSIVERKSDIAIVTSDNPRTEDPAAIIEDIKEGLEGKNYMIIPDRKEAIYMAVELAQKKDIVLIAGKGHEDCQILKEETIHFDDREVVLQAIEELGK